MKNSTHEKHEKCEKKIFKNPRITRELPPHASVLQSQNTEKQLVQNSLLCDKDLIQFIRNFKHGEKDNSKADSKGDNKDWLLSTLSAKNIKKHLNQPLYNFVGLRYLVRQCNFNDEDLAILDEQEIFNKENFEKFYSDDSYVNYQRLLTEILQIYKQTDKEIFQAVKSIFEYVYEQKLSNEISLYQQFSRYVYQALLKSKDFLQKISQANIAELRTQVQNQNQNQKLWHSLAAIRENLIKYSLYVKDPSNEDYQILLPLKSFFKKVDLVEKGVANVANTKTNIDNTGNANTIHANTIYTNTTNTTNNTNISITNIHINIPQSDLASIVQQNEICIKLYIVSQHFYELVAFQKLSPSLKKFYKSFYNLLSQKVCEKLKDHPYLPFIAMTQLPLTIPYYSYQSNKAIQILISQHNIDILNIVIGKIFSKEFDLPNNTVQESYNIVVNLMTDYEGIAQQQISQEQIVQQQITTQNQTSFDSIIQQQWQCIKETMLKHYEQMQILHKLNMIITFYLNAFNSFKEACRSKIPTSEIEAQLNELTLNKKRCPEQNQTQIQMETQMI